MTSLRVLTILALVLPGFAGEPDTEPVSGEWIVAVDIEALARGVYPQAEPIPGPAAFNSAVVSRRFRQSSGEDEFELGIGIYRDSASAAARRFVFEPQMGRSIRELEAWNVFSRCFFTVQVRNVVANLELPVDLEWEAKKQRALALVSGLKDPAVIVLGEAPRLPAIRLLHARSVGDRRYEAIYAVDPEVLGSGHRDRNGNWMVSGPDMEREFTIRAATPEGLVADLPMSRFPQEAWNWPAEPKEGALTDQEREEIVEKIRTGDWKGHQWALLVLKLARDPTELEVPLFDEIIRSEASGPAKGYAFRGLHEVMKSEGIVLYRLYAYDRGQHDLVRRDAAIRIGQYGDPPDIPKLEAILDEFDPEDIWPIENAIRNLKGLPPTD